MIKTVANPLDDGVAVACTTWTVFRPPGGPCGPVSPVAPCGPVAPVAPCVPVAPEAVKPLGLALAVFVNAGAGESRLRRRKSGLV